MQSEQTSSSISAASLLQSKRILGLRWNKQNWIKSFFAGCSTLAILVLVLIMLSLLEQGSGFTSSYQWELETYRKSGLEFVDIGTRPIKEHEELYGLVNQAYQAELNVIAGRDKKRRDAALLAQKHLEDGTEKLRKQIAYPSNSRHSNDEAPEPSDLKLKAQAEAIWAKEDLKSLFTQTEIERLRHELIHRLLKKDEPQAPFVSLLIEQATTKESEAQQRYSNFHQTLSSLDEAIYALLDWEETARKIAIDNKALASARYMALAEKEQLLKAAEEAASTSAREQFLKDAQAIDTTPIEFEERLVPLLNLRGSYYQAVKTYRTEIQSAFEELPKNFDSPQTHELVTKAHSFFSIHLKHIDESVSQLENWNWEQNVTKLRAFAYFLTGNDWITHSSWQDFYGVLPLLTGSIVIALIALAIALPFSLAAAIYTNQFASKREQDFIKPIIEFIQAIPSVVIGFIGIALVGNLIKDLSQISWLQWIPGFPIQERLNMFTAGVLLALMAIPTIFSLSEDALQNVPRAFSEASEALGATKLQSVFRVIVPSATSGILAAVLLGLGRIIGETMVVLLVAGNRIAIPDFSDGFGTIFQPAHTLTGIIAQELGEVSKGSVHWQALFMVGILLFSISLLINWASRAVARKFQLPKL